MDPSNHLGGISRLADNVWAKCLCANVCEYCSAHDDSKKRFKELLFKSFLWDAAGVGSGLQELKHKEIPPLTDISECIN